MRAILGAVLAGAMASGCYEISEPIYKTGAYADMAGTFNCQGMFKKGNETFTEVKTGWLFADYRYQTMDGTRFTLASIGDKFYAAQVETAKAQIGVAFIDTPQEGKLLMLVPDVMGKGPYIDALVKKHQIVIQPGQADRMAMRLGGSTEQIKAFVEAHEKGLLTVVMDCTRI